MKNNISTLEKEARAMLDQTSSLQRAAESLRANRNALGRATRGYPEPETLVESEGYCPVSWLLRDLIYLIIESPDQPVSRLEPIIRQRVTEQHFCDETGDVPTDRHIPGSIDTQVTVLVEVLERVRNDAINRGALSAHPAAIPQCG